ncbi:MAG TPA: prolyl oligopeptidase family serine peptidase [Burkholderiales bacterium]|nr:prolyl oligopeptidase family serine peptidase [Burkholderiales bacterium]
MKGGRNLLRAAAVSAVALFGALSPSLAQDDHGAAIGPRLIEEKVNIPAGDGRYAIVATILRPEGPGPYGAVVLNHGVSASARERARESSDLLIGAASVFARRGFAVVMPLRRGFGETGGQMAEDPGSCANPDYMRAERNAADDVMAAYEYARSLPYVDRSRMILAGQSAGAMVALFTAGTREPEGLVAVLGFAAGRGGDPIGSPGEPCAVEPVAEVLDRIGRTVKVPVLLHYAENDRFFAPKTSRLWFDRFAANGARAEYVLQPAFGTDGHYLFGSTLGVRYWLPAVEGFLGRHGVQFARLDADEPERRMLFALDRLPNVKSDACRSLYRAFLEAPGPRAYAVSDDGRCGFSSGVQDARDAAIRQCGAVAKENCMLYAVDDAVIWKEAVAGQ